MEEACLSCYKQSNPCSIITGYGPRHLPLSLNKMSSPNREVSHVVKFNGINFPIWKFGCWLKLEQHNLVKIVTGEETKPVKVTIHT